jgi:hypothetical protein
MKSPWPDWMVLLTLALTLVLVFALVFSQRPSGTKEPPLLWRTPTGQESSGSLQI